MTQLPLVIGGNEFEAPGPVTRTLHFVLQFIKQTAEFRRVFLGACESDWPVLGAAEICVQEAMQVNGCALKPRRAPREARPRHSVVLLFHCSCCF
jgi:hypothetical protein